jgi:serine/threonine-protein kinase HipA
MTTLGVTWDKRPVGLLEKVAEPYGDDYRFTYAGLDAPRISVSLPVRVEPFSASASRPFFEALLPEGSLREALAGMFRLPLTDSLGLLARLGRDCAGALQIMEAARLSETPDVRWLDDDALGRLIVELPRRPLGIAPEGRMRLSLAGVQDKLVLVRDRGGRFGEPLHGMPTTHIVKPEPAATEFPGIAINEYFCMRLAAACGLPTADVELTTVAGRTCLVVARFDRDHAATPARRLHQEDLCQAIGLIPGYKYAAPDRPRPSFEDLADVLRAHGSQSGRDRITVGRMAVFNFLIGNADAHGKNVSFMHDGRGRVRLAPLYDLVSTAAWPDLDRDLAMAIGDEFDAAAITHVSFDDLADVLGLTKTIFARDRRLFVADAQAAAADLASEARRDGWHDPVMDTIVAVMAERAKRTV